MANSLLKLTVESSEYDAKLKKAAEGIRHLADVAHNSDGDLTGLEESTLEYIKAVGEMETKSRSAAGQVRELESTYKELKVIYDQLNDVEKADEGGRALAASLEQLKQRAQDAKTQLDNASKSLQQNEEASKEDSGALEKLASKFTLNIDALKLFDMGLTAAKAALDVAKDAFFASEANVDEWGRTVDASKSLYEGFLTALNTGDISGYLNNINQIVTAARAAYDELDRLGTMKTIQSPQKSAQQTENDRMRMMLQTGRYIAPVDGRKASMQDGQKLTKAQLQSIERQLQNGMKTVTTLIGNEVKQTGKAIDAVYNRQAKELGMGIKEFRKGTSSMAEFDKRMEGYRKYQEWDKQARTEFAKQGGRGNVDFDKSNPYADFKKWGTFRVDGQRYNDLVQLIQQRDQQAGQAYQTQGQMYRAINRADNKINATGGKTGKTGKQDIQFADDSIMAQEKEVQRLTKLWKTAGDGVRDGYLKQLEEAQQKLAEMTGKAKGPDLDKLFPDMSAQNYNTGYAGSAKAKVDSATVDLAMGPVNLDSVNAYISTMKSALKDADFGSDLYNSMTEKLKDATTMSTLLQELMERGLQGADLENTAKALKDKLLSPEGIDQTAIQSFIDTLNEQIKEAGGVGLKLNTDTGAVTDDKGKGKDDGEELKKFNEGVGKLTGGLSSVTSGLKAVGVEIPKEVDQVIGVINGISQVISGVGTIISIFGTTAITSNTAAVGLNTAAIGGLIAAIEFNTASNFIPFFANGGIVPHAANGYFVGGNSFSGDNTPIMANAGELVLNKAQQGNLASMLTDGERGGGNAQPYLDGEKIYLGLQAYMRRCGLGEIVTSER